MTDIFDKKKRSFIMSRIRGRNTGPEKLLRKELRRRGLKFRTYAKLPGTPDIVFPTEKVVVFCDGTFWHGYRFASWKDKLKPFWLKKITTNIRRDRRNKARLRRLGWKPVRFWDAKIMKDVAGCVDRLELVLARRPKAKGTAPRPSSSAR